jgi:hypothetical protein
MAVPVRGATPPEPLSSGRRRALTFTAASLAIWSWPAQALEAPSGTVVLTVQGRVRMPNDGKRAQFDLAMLEALPQRTHQTRTPWFTQARRFTGPLLRDVLAATAAQGSNLRLVALNDYRVDMPMDDAMRHDVVIARLMDDKPMTVRDKGPLFIIYPFDAQPELRSAIYYGRSAWQLRTIEVL